METPQKEIYLLRASFYARVRPFQEFQDFPCHAQEYFGMFGGMYKLGQSNLGILGILGNLGILGMLGMLGILGNLGILGILVILRTWPRKSWNSSELLILGG